MHAQSMHMPSQIAELPHDYYVGVGLTALLLPCMLALLSLGHRALRVARRGRSKRPSETCSD
jgi:hypothetical protein